MSFSKMFRNIFLEIFCQTEQAPGYVTEDVTRVPTGSQGRKRQSMTQLTPIHVGHEDSPATSSPGPQPHRTSSMTNLNPNNAIPVSNGDRITIHDGEQTFV